MQAQCFVLNEAGTYEELFEINKVMPEIKSTLPSISQYLCFDNWRISKNYLKI